MVDTNTITGTFNRAQAENLGISRNFIRSACLDGRLKYSKAGKKYLIYYPNLLELLKNGDQPPQKQNIRKLNERML